MGDAVQNTEDVEAVGSGGAGAGKRSGRPTTDATTTGGRTDRCTTIRVAASLLRLRYTQHMTGSSYATTTMEAKGPVGRVGSAEVNRAAGWLYTASGR